jgi:YVTN family beta-propeller protein
VHPAGTFVYATNSGSGTVSVIDTTTNTVVAAVSVGPLPKGVSVHPAGTFVYVTKTGVDHSVSVIDTATNTVVATVPTGNLPNAFGQFVGPQPPIFGDVPRSHSFWAWIEALFKAGLTGGCEVDPLLYCPDAGVTRDQMAVFLVRGLHGAGFDPPAATGTMFADVPTTHPFARWIEQLAGDGITVGCSASPPQYCPFAEVTREQMAVFLVRARHGAAYDPPAATGTVFADVPTTRPFAKWIEQLARDGITGGCGTSTYCPDATVTRGQMAAFLVRAFNLRM